jgi:hypothetical protein
MKSLEQFNNELLADRIIDSADVEKLSEILFEDGELILKRQSFFLKSMIPFPAEIMNLKRESLFIDAIRSSLLEHENSPSEIDAEEASQLYYKIKGDGQIDGTENNLLLNLKNKAKSFTSTLEPLLI